MFKDSLGFKKTTIAWIIAILFLIWIFFPTDNYLPTNEENLNNIEGEILEEDLGNISLNDSEKIKIDEINSEYPHFKNLTITFSMKGLEAPIRRQRMYNAFEIIEDAVGEFNFVEIENYDNANIKINFPKRDNLRTIGETTPTFNEEGNIEGGEITMINIEKEGCDEYPNSEIHEILHVFGFDHMEDTIMSEYAEGCRPLKSEWSMQYVEHLKFVYSSGKRGIEHPEILYLEYYSSCPEGYYEVIGSEDCCPEPNMQIIEGYCEY